MRGEYLFPVRRTRRDFLAAAGAAGIAATTWKAPSVRGDEPAVTIGGGQHAFQLDPAWGQLPEGMKYGFGCAVVVDSQDRVYVTSRSANPCVAIFGSDGKLLETWSKEFATGIGMESPDQVAATAHGLYWSKESAGEFLYWTENIAKNSEKKLGARVYKTDLTGKVLFTLGNVAEESGTAQKFAFTNPTDVAVAPNGDLYIVDGYGSQQVYRFDREFKHLRTIGGRGKEHGQFNVCHGVWVNTLKKEPELYIADRANHRIEVFSLELDYKRTIEEVRLPCCFYQHDGHLYVPELGARVSILDVDDKIVARLGDGQGIKTAEIQQHPDKFATPHALTLSSSGDLYVVEWLPFGRPRKFRRVKSTA